MMRTFRFGLKPAVLCLLYVIVLLSAVSAIAAEDTETGGVVRNKLLILGDKSEHAVIVGERKFVVTGDTVIFNMHGKQIPLIDLAVPCEAMVQYRLVMDKSPVALRVQVKKNLPGASVSPLFHVREK
jgi:hypothetical protein